MGLEGTYLDIIQAIYDKPKGKIVLNDEELHDESISSKIRKKTRMPTLTTFIQHSIRSLSNSNQTRKRNKRNSH